uniref:Conotoxin 14.2 n=1 Tax=Conus litteratus TaxID=89445 RepID=E2DEL8_CONLT|nr:conotoxin 14.2 precursor [Conus litteratus]
MKLVLAIILVLMLTTSLTCGFNHFSNNGKRAYGPHDRSAAHRLVSEKQARSLCHPPCTGLSMCHGGMCGYIRFR